jgi:hypothetical protein
MSAVKNGAIAALAVAVAACGSSSKSTAQDQTPAMKQALFVATTAGTLVSFDVATGQSRGGEVTGVSGPVDLQGLPEGYVGVNLSTGGTAGEVLFVDAHTMLEKTRFASSSGTGKRPVHSYVSPTQAGKRYWLTLNDGDGTAATNSALLVDVTKGSPDYLKPIGEVPLGIGHHKAGWSAAKPRAVITNIADCDRVVQVVDYSDPKAIQALATWSATDLGGFDCAATPARRPSPHGCATAATSGHVYCNLTGSGEILSVDVDADPPTFRKVSPPLGGTGAGASMAHPGGWFVFTAHNTPREANGGRPNQIGTLSIVDTRQESVDGVPTVKDVALFYDGPDGTRPLAGTDEEGTGISHLTVSADGKTLFVIPGSAGTPAERRARKVLVVDVSSIASDPASARQLASIDVGDSHGDNSDALSGDGKLLFVTNNAGATVSAIDTAALQVVRTFTVPAGSPKVVATFGDAEGCSKPVH